MRLRDYVDRGGFLFAEGCCGGSEFDRGFRQLMHDVFPEKEYELRLLPPEHPIWRAEEPVNPKYLRPLWGIDVGCRTSVVFCPNDLSCFWELARTTRNERLPQSVQDEVDACLAIGANVMAYATNREVKFKNEFFTTADAQAPADNFDRGKLYTARLQHPGGCNAAPGALRNLMQLASEKLGLRVDTEPRELAMSDPQIFRYHLVFMHGRHNFRLTPAERKTTAHLRGTRRHARGRRDLFEPRVWRRVCPRDGRDLSRAQARADSGEPSDVFTRIRRQRPVGGRAARAATGRRRTHAARWFARASPTWKASSWAIATPSSFRPTT